MYLALFLLVQTSPCPVPQQEVRRRLQRLAWELQPLPRINRQEWELQILSILKSILEERTTFVNQYLH